jgi:enoyl-[acyl-carrier-protein] reductase (NADH)
MRPPEISEESWQRDVLARAPLKRESSPDDIADLIVTLLKSETITGETIRVDSGRHLAGPGTM